MRAVTNSDDPIKALAAFAKADDRLYEAEVYRLKGKLLLAGKATPLSEVEACFEQALAVARRQQAKSLELRAAMSLAKLWQERGKGHAARELLTGVYHGFTEGFDTSDLQTARQLLEEFPTCAYVQALRDRSKATFN